MFPEKCVQTVAGTTQGSPEGVWPDLEVSEPLIPYKLVSLVKFWQHRKFVMASSISTKHVILSFTTPHPKFLSNTLRKPYQKPAILEQPARVAMGVLI